MLDEQNDAIFACSKCSMIREKSGKTHCSTNGLKKIPQPKNCPSNEQYRDIIDESLKLYIDNPEDVKLAKMAAVSEGMCYVSNPESEFVIAKHTRIEDTIIFAKLMNYKKIGIGTCIGLLNETYELEKILRAQEFQTYSICCKVGGIDKQELGVSEEQKIRPNTFESMCNPIAQAKFLNYVKTDMNIIVGLCVGHDMLFTKYADAPVTTLVAKDRVTGHNPVSVLYNQNFYYKRLQKQKIKVEI
jgi:uncharacterized metal-binding protein